MSWLKENYDKAALGGAAVITLSVVALIFTGNSGEATKINDPRPINAFEVEAKTNLVELEEAMANNAEPVYMQRASQDVYSFIAYPTFRIRDKVGIQELDPETVIQGAPLEWWKKYSLDDYQFEGADKKDNDNDGFTNYEEFTVGTNPVDATSRPNLIEKLKFLSAAPISYRIEWTKIEEGRASMNFRSSLTTRGSQDISRVGDTFPTKGQPEQFLNRFKVKNTGEGINPDNRQDTFYEIEDTKKQVVGGKGYTFMFDEKRDPNAKLEKLEIQFENKTKVLGLVNLDENQ